MQKALHAAKTHAKKHINKVVVGLLSIVVLGSIGAGAFAYNQLNQRFEETSLENQRYQAQLQDSLDEADKKAQDAAESAQRTHDSLEEEKKKSETLAQDLAATQEASQEQIDQLREKLSQASTGSNGSDLADEWSRRVGNIICHGNDGTSWSGSATAFLKDDGTIFNLTNFHVLADAAWCVVGFPGDNQTYYIPSENMGWDSSLYDWAYFIISSPSTYLTSYSRSWNICSENQTLIGSRVMIFGYPSDGATSTITTTQGIISGIDKEYFVTDAKIDHGNSGGAAIDASNDCFIGIPTAAVSGQIESYGRILDINKVF